MKDLVEKLADKIMNYSGKDWNMDINHFDWVPGVGLYGIFHAYKSTGNQKYLDFLIAWSDKYLDKAYEQQTVNSANPLLTVLEVYKITNKEKYLKVCTDIAENILSEAPLTENGGLEHTVTENVKVFSGQLWADTLFMVCIFLAKLGQLTGEKKYIDFSLKQLKIHHKSLFNSNEGLYYHAWDCKDSNNMSAVFWGRANAWILYSTIEILNIAGEFSGRSEIVSNIRKHAETLALFQKPDGSIATIINDLSSYSELSATAGIAAGIKLAMDTEILNSDFNGFHANLIHAVKENIDNDGILENVSTGTPVMINAEAYKNIGISPTLYGQGLAIIAMAHI